MKMHFAILGVTAMTIALTGCNPPAPKTMDFTYIATNQKPSDSTNVDSQVQLAQAAVSINKSLQQLAAIQKATNPGVKAPMQLDAKAIGMSQMASLNWNGPILPLLQKIAQSTSYKVKVIGETPPTPVMVNVDANNQTLADILRNATFQAGSKADVNVYPNTRTIELRYYA